jgi:hypothetical protein
VCDSKRDERELKGVYIARWKVGMSQRQNLAEVIRKEGWMTDKMKVPDSVSDSTKSGNH